MTDTKFPSSRQRRRMRLRYLRHAAPLDIQLVTETELMELSPRRARRIREAGEWHQEFHVNAWVRSPSLLSGSM